MTAPRPWMKFGPRRWRNDMNLRLCSAAARGVWIELICLMHESKVYGHLLLNGRQPTERELSVLTAIPVLDIGKALDELEANGVFSRAEDGTVFSRAMVNDEEQHEKLSAFGLKGQRIKQQKTNKKDRPLSLPSSHGSSPPLKQERESEEESERTIPVVPSKLGGPKFELPDDWQPELFDPVAEPAAHRISTGWDEDRLQSELDGFRSNHRRKRSRYSDWQDIWAGWVRNAAKFDKRDERESESRTKASAPRSHADLVLEEYANRAGATK